MTRTHTSIVLNHQEYGVDPLAQLIKSTGKEYQLHDKTHTKQKLKNKILRANIKSKLPRFLTLPADYLMSPQHGHITWGSSDLKLF